MRSESASGLMVKALGWKLRDLGLSPSQCSPFPAIRNCSRENYLFNIQLYLHNYVSIKKLIKSMANYNNYIVDVANMQYNSEISKMST